MISNWTSRGALGVLVAGLLSVVVPHTAHAQTVTLTVEAVDQYVDGTGLLSTDGAIAPQTKYGLVWWDGQQLNVKSCQASYSLGSPLKLRAAYGDGTMGYWTMASDEALGYFRDFRASVVQDKTVRVNGVTGEVLGTVSIPGYRAGETRIELVFPVVDLTVTATDRNGQQITGGRIWWDTVKGDTVTVTYSRYLYSQAYRKAVRVKGALGTGFPPPDFYTDVTSSVEAGKTVRVNGVTGGPSGTATSSSRGHGTETRVDVEFGSVELTVEAADELGTFDQTNTERLIWWDGKASSVNTAHGPVVLGQTVKVSGISGAAIYSGPIARIVNSAITQVGFWDVTSSIDDRQITRVDAVSGQITPIPDALPAGQSKVQVIFRKIPVEIWTVNGIDQKITGAPGFVDVLGDGATLLGPSPLKFPDLQGIQIVAGTKLKAQGRYAGMSSGLYRDALIVDGYRTIVDVIQHDLVAQPNPLGDAPVVTVTTVPVPDQVGAEVWVRFKNMPPVANAGPDQTVPRSGDLTSVTLDGSGSSDPDGTIQSYKWTGQYVNASGPSASVDLPPGQHTIALTLIDDKGATTTDQVEINVESIVVDLTVAAVDQYVSGNGLLSKDGPVAPDPVTKYGEIYWDSKGIDKKEIQSPYALNSQLLLKARYSDGTMGYWEMAEDLPFNYFKDFRSSVVKDRTVRVNGVTGAILGQVSDANYRAGQTRLEIVFPVVDLTITTTDASGGEIVGGRVWWSGAAEDVSSPMTYSRYLYSPTSRKPVEVRSVLGANSGPYAVVTGDIGLGQTVRVNGVNGGLLGTVASSDRGHGAETRVDLEFEVVALTVEAVDQYATPAGGLAVDGPVVATTYGEVWWDGVGQNGHSFPGPYALKTDLKLKARYNDGANGYWSGFKNFLDHVVKNRTVRVNGVTGDVLGPVTDLTYHQGETRIELVFPVVDLSVQATDESGVFNSSSFEKEVYWDGVSGPAPAPGYSDRYLIDPLLQRPVNLKGICNSQVGYSGPILGVAGEMPFVNVAQAITACQTIRLDAGTGQITPNAGALPSGQSKVQVVFRKIPVKIMTVDGRIREVTGAQGGSVDIEGDGQTLLKGSPLEFPDGQGIGIVAGTLVKAYGQYAGMSSGKYKSALVLPGYRTTLDVIQHALVSNPSVDAPEVRITTEAVPGLTGAEVWVKFQNQPPVAGNDSYTTDEDQPLSVLATLGVLANDTDLEQDALSAVLVQGPVHGTLALAANGSFIYTPNANANGPDSFTYKASDGTVSGNPATVAIAVNPVNDPPVAGPGSLTTNEDVAGNGLLPGTDVDGDALTYSIATQGSKGTVAITDASTGAFTYTPEANYNGPDSFTYTVTDGHGGTANGTVNVTVTAVNDAPTVTDIANQTVNEDVATGALAFGVNDVEAAAGSLGVSGSSSNPSLVPNASIVIGGSGASRTVTVTPAANQSGSATITVMVTDGDGGTASDTFVLTVTDVNDAPLANAGSAQTVNEGATGVTLDGSASSDPDGDALTYRWAQTGGTTVALTGERTVTATFTAPQISADETLVFQLTVKDKSGQSSSATTTVLIKNVDAPPVAPNWMFVGIREGSDNLLWNASIGNGRNDDGKDKDTKDKDSKGSDDRKGDDSHSSRPKVRNEDIIKFSRDAKGSVIPSTLAMFFDGSAYFKSDEKLDAVEVDNFDLDDELEMVFSVASRASIRMEGLEIRPGDLVLFNPSSTPRFSRYLDGSRLFEDYAKWSTKSRENIDAVSIKKVNPNEVVLFLTMSNSGKIGSIKFDKNDIVQVPFNVTTGIPDKAGASKFFDAGARLQKDSSMNLDAVDVVDNDGDDTYESIVFSTSNSGKLKNGLELRAGLVYVFNTLTEGVEVLFDPEKDGLSRRNISIASISTLGALRPSASGSKPSSSSKEKNKGKALLAKTGEETPETTAEVLPEAFGMDQNYPNPFNPSTTIRYALPEAANVTLVIYNILGQQVRTLASGAQGAGYHTVVWDGQDEVGRRAATGMYVYRFQAGTFTQTRKMLFTK